MEGPSARGEVTIQTGGAVEEAVRDWSEAVEREPVPAEERQHVLRFQRLLRGEGGGAEAE